MKTESEVNARLCEAEYKIRRIAALLFLPIRWQAGEEYKGKIDRIENGLSNRYCARAKERQRLDNDKGFSAILNKLSNVDVLALAVVELPNIGEHFLREWRYLLKEVESKKNGMRLLRFQCEQVRYIVSSHPLRFEIPSPFDGLATAVNKVHGLKPPESEVS
jgi:hypothetical protein